MDFEFCIQDPTYVDTPYHYEAIIDAAKDAVSWRGVYAFASRDGVQWLFDDQVVKDLVHRGGEIDLLVGLDAITNRRTLEQLHDMEQQHDRFRPRVFWNDVVPLFHPKLSVFTYAGGGCRLIVGSGNLTPGGLTNNIEGYTVVSAGPGETIDVSALDDFFARHVAEIRSIDDDALQRADENSVSHVGSGENGRRTAFTSPPRIRRPVRMVPGRGEGRVALVDRVLIAQIPRAGGRWSQVHFNADIVREYFRLTEFETQRAYLSHVVADGSRSEVEVRRCVFSVSNRNHRIEFAGAKGRDYPASRPILVAVEHQIRVFDYMLLVPGDVGFPEMTGLSVTLPTVGRGVPRVITDLDTLEQSWPNCPLLYQRSSENELF